MNKEGAEVFVVITNIACKALITVVMLGCFVWVIYFWMQAPENWGRAIANALFPPTIYKIVSHFFPVTPKARARAKAKK